MIAVSSPFKIRLDTCTEGESGAHSLEFFIPATLRLWRGVPAEIKKKLSHMVPNSQKKRKEGVHTFINRCHTQTCNKMITNLGKTKTKKISNFQTARRTPHEHRATSVRRV